MKTLVFVLGFQENQSEHPIIFLKDVSFWELEAIIDFIYNGQVDSIIIFENEKISFEIDR